jgi:DNA-binding MarR family transcriptional regulator
MDRMTSMTTFVKVVESEGFSAAARALGISPSMATTHVRALEERLGVRLLNRSTRRVSLTEAGQIYYDRCLQILAEVEDAERVAQALQHPEATLGPSCVGSGPAREADALDDDKTIVGGVQFFDLWSLVGNSKAADLMSRTAGRTTVNGMRSGRGRDQHRSRE